MGSAATVSVNGRSYHAPDRPVVVVCIDGSEAEYFERGLAAGTTPALARFQREGVYRLARSVVPSFTNPNNLSIVTGAPPAVHGISGNYFYDPATGQEVMMNDPKFLRCETILAALSHAGARVAVVTAKDKLRRLLGHGMQGICFSSEKADQTTTADHGMNAKAHPDGTPQVVYLRPLLEALVGPGRARVILPITDPYVAHHGALGSFATIYLDDAAQGRAVASRLGATPGIAEVYDNAAGCARFELPRDRVGDLIVIGDAHTVLGKSPAEHDLSLLEEPLRSHGGVSEQTVPFVINRPLADAHARRLARADDLRNFDLFDYVLNGVN